MVFAPLQSKPARYVTALLACLVGGAFLNPLRSVARETPHVENDAVGSPPALSATRPSTTRPLDRFAAVRGAVGFWRVARDPDGVWWFLGPRDQVEFLNTVTTVQPSLRGREEAGADFLSRDWPAQAGGEGDDARLDRWARATLGRVADAGFKGVGAWSHPVLHRHDVPITRDLNLWTWARVHAERLFDPEWAKAAEAAVATQVGPLNDNVNLVGYFTDNELDWGDAASGPGYYFDGLPAADPNRSRVTQTVRQLWSTVEAFNRDWGSTLQNWSQLDGWRELPRRPVAPYEKLSDAWLSTLAAEYFRVTTALVRKYDPNHLILGVRYRGAAPWQVVAASKDLTDAQSLNYYVSDGKLDAAMFRSIYELSGQPLLITEYSFHALDGRSGNRNTVGFPAQVRDQAARAEGYRQFTTRLARVPWVIGADWFQWMDEPASGRRGDGEDANFGVVDMDDQPYEQLVESVRATTPLLNPLHADSHRDDGKDLWREDYTSSNRPTVHVPHLDRPIRLNGELSDWPAAARIAGVRRADTLGSQRSDRPAPNVYLGWKGEGMYVALEVFDRDLATVPADGWWWSRDSVEFWISTKPIARDMGRFNADCHHFFFVPVDFPARNGVGGVVGRWHSPGDGLAGHQVPHPTAKHSIRVLPDRYVVEIFLPAAALNGFDPRQQPRMGFNVHVRDHQEALEYFWSAPKQVITQARPNTWGVAVLGGVGPTKPADAAIIANTDLGSATGAKD